MVRESSHNLTQGAYEALRADLLACRIAPGSRLKIQDLCSQHAVSLGATHQFRARLKGSVELRRVGGTVQGASAYHENALAASLSMQL